MAGSATTLDDEKAWVYAFAILLLVSVAMLALRLSGRQFLVLEFETSLIYFPTVLSGIVAAYVTMNGRRRRSRRSTC
jgi:predicted tellurium resistance membrane protein TerC